jgi:putative ABC transport system substrate-binding protein
MSICLRRREFIAGLGGAAAWPLAARAQRLQRACNSSDRVLGGRSGPNRWGASFYQGLKEVGYVEGQNVAAIIESMA